MLSSRPVETQARPIVGLLRVPSAVRCKILFPKEVSVVFLTFRRAERFFSTRLTPDAKRSRGR